LHLLDVAVVPERLEDSVPEAEDQDVLDGLLAEVMVDAVDLAFVKYRVDERVQLARGSQIAPEGLLDDHARPGRRYVGALRAPGKARLSDVAHQGGVFRGRGREIEEAVSGDPPFLIEIVQEASQSAEGLRVLEGARLIEERTGEALPPRRGAVR